MYPTMLTVLRDVRFHELLLAFDRDLAEPVRVAGCANCGAVLHSARYPRKPRGVPLALTEEHRRRLSFCCAKDGCRQRATPPSLRFLGRKVYLGALVVLVSALRCGPTPVRIRQLQEVVGVSRTTVLRWRQWWCSVFTNSPFWCAAAGAFMPPVATTDLPASLLKRFVGEAEEQLIALLRFLGPLTAGSRAVRAF